MSGYVPSPQIATFFESEIYPLVSLLINGNYNLPEIQREFSENLNAIYSEYGRLNVELCDKPPKHIAKDAFLPFGFRWDEKKPFLIIFVQQLLIFFNQLAITRWHDFRQCFENIIVIGLMHEIYHIRSNQLIKDGCSSESKNPEVVAWALTCECAIRPLVELYQRELIGSDYQTYLMWVQCGRNAKNPRWENFIADLYSGIKERK